MMILKVLLPLIIFGASFIITVIEELKYKNYESQQHGLNNVLFLMAVQLLHHLHLKITFFPSDCILKFGA